MRILKIHSLPSVKTWLDKDEIMLHACFQLLKDFIEKEAGDTHCNYDAHKDFIDELRFLYKWWETRKDSDDSSDEQMDEDDAMLLRLMKIRTGLWT